MKTILLLGVLTMMPPPQIVPPGTVYVLNGVLTRDGTTEPIAGAQITLQASNANPAASRSPAAGLPPREVTPRQLFTTTTDGRGQFQIKDVAPGRYGMRAQKDGYFTVPPNPAIVVIVDASTPGKVEKISLIRSTSLTGHVHDSEGQPIQNATVEVMTLTATGPDPYLISTSQANTDDRGEYSILGLRPAIDYYVVVDLPARRPNQLQATRTSNYARTQIFYPDVLEPSKATPVVLGSDTDSTTLELNIHVPKTFLISGKVSVPPGSPPLTSVPPFPVFFLQRRGLQLATLPVMVNFAPYDSEGKFELRDVTPGSYELFVSLSRGPRPTVGRVPIEITDRDIAGISVVLKDGADVIAQVVSNETGFTVPPAASIRLIPMDVPDEVLTGMNRSSPSGAPGSFSIANVPDGRYEIRASGFPADVYLKDVRAGSTSVIDSGLTLSDGQPQSIQVTVARGVGSIRGTVVDGSGKPASNCRVMLTPPLSLQGVRRLYRASTINSLCEFTIDNIAPGEYRLFALEGRSSENIWDPLVRNRYESRGTRVVVTAGGSVTVQLSLISKSPK